MTRNASAMGALHPILFFLFVYGISLVMAIFVCRIVYFAINGNDTVMKADPPPSKALSYSGNTVSAQATAFR